MSVTTTTPVVTGVATHLCSEHEVMVITVFWTSVTVEMASLVLEPEPVVAAFSLEPVGRTVPVAIPVEDSVVELP